MNLSRHKARPAAQDLPFRNSTMSHSEVTKIRAEIHNCLDAIEPGSLPIAQIANTVARLKNDPTWTASQILEFEVAAHRIVAGIIDDEFEPGPAVGDDKRS